jgi:hypothetical protein
LGLCGEIALVEAFAGTLFVCDEPTLQKGTAEKEEPTKTK